MEVHEGLTPVVGIVILTLIVVAGAGTLYTTLDNVMQTADTDVDLNPEVLQVESCFRDNAVGTTNISLRNTGEKQVNVSQLDVVLDGDILSNSEYSLSKNTVNPGMIFQVGISPTVQRDTAIKLLTSNEEKSFACPTL